LVQTISNVAFIAAGFANVAAVTHDGYVYVRGSGSYGLLANNSTSNFATFTQIPNLANIFSASVGQKASLFLAKDGTMYTTESV
jgi:alpha-tubulin suppressor-like RCC1 family protein